QRWPARASFLPQTPLLQTPAETGLSRRTQVPLNPTLRSPVSLAKSFYSFGASRGTHSLLTSRHVDTRGCRNSLGIPANIRQNEQDGEFRRPFLVSPGRTTRISCDVSLRQGSRRPQFARSGRVPLPGHRHVEGAPGLGLRRPALGDRPG